MIPGLDEGCSRDPDGSCSSDPVSLVLGQQRLRSGWGKKPGSPLGCGDAERFLAKNRKKKSEVTSRSKQAGVWGPAVNLWRQMERPDSLSAVEGSREALRAHPVGSRPLSPCPSCQG